MDGRRQVSQLSYHFETAPVLNIENSTIVNPARQAFTSPLIDESRLTVDRTNLRKQLPIISAVHDAVKSGLEQAREAKAVGSSLQCSVVIQTAHEQLIKTLGEYSDELDVIFVVSSVELNSRLPASPEWAYTVDFAVNEAVGTVHVLPPKQHKCSRCWKYTAQEEKDDALCARCGEVVESLSASS